MATPQHLQAPAQANSSGPSSASGASHRRIRTNYMGPRIAELRQAAGLDHAAFLARLHRRGWNLERTVLVKLERGSRLIVDWELCLLADTLGVSLDDLRPPSPLVPEHFLKGPAGVQPPKPPAKRRAKRKAPASRS